MERGLQEKKMTQNAVKSSNTKNIKLSIVSSTVAPAVTIFQTLSSNLGRATGLEDTMRETERDNTNKSPQKFV